MVPRVATGLRMARVADANLSLGPRVRPRNVISWVLCESQNTMQIRPYEERDLEAVVRLSLRAWAPVFESIEAAMPVALSMAIRPSTFADDRGFHSRCLAGKPLRPAR